MATHILDVAPKSAKVIFENNEVRAIEITMMKGQTVPMHSHKMGLSYSLNAGRIRSMTEDGKSRVFDVEKGEIGWSNVDGAETHAVENLGGVLRELCVEFKGRGSSLLALDRQRDKRLQVTVWGQSSPRSSRTVALPSTTG